MEETYELTLGLPPRLKVTHFHSEARELVPDADAVARLLKSVRSLRLTANPRHAPMGLDGTTYTIRFTEGTASAEYSWWCDPPTEWASLAGIASQLMALAGHERRMHGFSFRDPDSVSETSAP